MYLSIYPDQEYQDSGVTCARAFLARFRSSIPRVEGDERPPTHRPFSSTSSPLFLFEPSHRFTCDYRWTATGLWPRYDGNAHFAICCPSCAIRGSPRSDGCALLLVWKNMQSYFFKFMQVFRICTRFAKNRKVNVRSFCMNLYPVWFLVEDLFLIDPIFVWIITLSYFITSLRIYLYRIIMNRNIDYVLMYYESLVLSLISFTHLSMYCVSLTYAMHAASSPSRCTWGFRIVVFTALQFFPKTA